MNAGRMAGVCIRKCFCIFPHGKYMIQLLYESLKYFVYCFLIDNYFTTFVWSKIFGNYRYDAILNASF